MRIWGERKGVLIMCFSFPHQPVQPNFKSGLAEAEVPPIPCHIHSGNVVNGKLVGPGKLEAYFFPPLVDVEPYRRDVRG